MLLLGIVHAQVVGSTLQQCRGSRYTHAGAVLSLAHHDACCMMQHQHAPLTRRCTHNCVAVLNAHTCRVIWSSKVEIARSAASLVKKDTYP